MKIADLKEGDQITGMVTVGEDLYMIANNSVHQIKLADSIDPKRIDPTVPNLQQKIFGKGSDSILVSRTMIFAHEICKGDVFEDSFNKEKIMNISIDLLRCVIDMDECFNIIKLYNKDAMSSVDDRRSVDLSMKLPSLGEKAINGETFFRKLSMSYLLILRTFWAAHNKEVDKIFDRTLDFVSKNYRDDERFIKFIQQLVEFSRMFKDWRNLIEHPKRGEYFKIIDYTYAGNNKISRPMFEVVSKKYPQEPVDLEVNMEKLIDLTISNYESLLCFLCERKLKEIAGYTFKVMEIPLKMRRYPHVRYGIALPTTKGPAPLG